MDGFIHVAAAGAKEAMLQQAVNAHNLANAPTVGFKADMVQAESVYLLGEGQETRAYKMVSAIDADLSSGALQQTGRDLDIAVNGKGWIAVQTPSGLEGLTRRGDLRVDPFGQLLNGAGDPVLGNDGPIALPPFSSIAIGEDGTISIVPQGEQPNTVAILDRIKLVNPPEETLVKDTSGMIVVSDGLPSLADANVRITSGALEASNVNSVASMVQMIELAREFEQFMKVVTVGEEMDTSSASLMRIQ
ncbi:MAG: flagellar basal body rod protein FlgF [Pseudomonadota bacterium]